MDLKSKTSARAVKELIDTLWNVNEANNDMIFSVI